MVRKTKGDLLFPRAEHDLESIFDYTVEHWSRRQAKAYLTELTVAFQALAAGTRVGRDAELGHRVMKLPVGSHVVFYRVTASAVEIVRVLHQAMDAPDISTASVPPERGIPTRRQSSGSRSHIHPQ